MDYSHIERKIFRIGECNHWCLRELVLYEHIDEFLFVFVTLVLFEKVEEKNGEERQMEVKT